MSIESTTTKSAEEQIFARLYTEPKLYFDHANKLSVGLFIDPTISLLYGAFEQLLIDSKKTDVLSICRQINRLDLMDLVIDLASKVSYDNSFETILDYVFDKRTELNFKTLLLKWNDKINSGHSVQEVLHLAQKDLVEISDIKQGGIKAISEIMKEMFDNIENNMRAKGLTGIASGIHDLDTFTGGFQPTDLVIVAADSSMGKTSAVLTWLNFIGKSGVPCAMYSLEMSSLQLVTRLSSQESEINAKHLLRGRLGMGELEKLNVSIGKLSYAPIYIDESCGNTLHGIVNSIHAMVIRYNVKVVVIDYLQLMSNEKKGGNKDQEIGGIATKLKNLAKELNITIIALSQLNRSKENRKSDMRPTMSALRASGEIEQAADIVMFVYRAEYYDILEDENGNSTAGKAELIIAKGRNIGLGVIEVLFDAHLTKFKNKTKDNYSNYSSSSDGNVNLSPLQPSQNFEHPDNTNSPF